MHGANSFGCAGATRGVDQVSEVIGSERCGALRIVEVAVRGRVARVRACQHVIELDEGGHLSGARVRKR